jgi:hypothetical protein
MNRYFIVSAALMALRVMGCGSQEYVLAPVSGVVKVDGKPVAGLRVAFEPVATEKNSAPGPESIAITNADGEFVLKTFDERPRTGAVVGKCRVRIWSLPANQEDSVFDDRSENYDPVAEVKALREQIRSAKKKGKVARPSGPIPLRYNDQTTLSFDVTEAGTESANFEIQSN